MVDEVSGELAPFRSDADPSVCQEHVDAEQRPAQQRSRGAGTVVAVAPVPKAPRQAPVAEKRLEVDAASVVRMFPHPLPPR